MANEVDRTEQAARVMHDSTNTPSIDGGKLSRVELAEVLRRHAWFLDSRPGGKRAVLIDRDLSGIALTGLNLSHANLTGSSFFESNLRKCRFDSATMFGCDFRQANLENASMIRADLRGSSFVGAVLIGANLFEADLREGGQVKRDRKGEFHGRGASDPSTARSGSAFSGANLTNATLVGVFAVKADFSDAIMRGCRLIRAHVRGANFAGCDLDGADFGQADTRDACFRGAVLLGTNFDQANIAGTDMEDTLSDKPNGHLLSALGVGLAELLQRHAKFTGSNGAEGALLDLTGFDLRLSSGSWVKACLSMVKASGAVFYGLDLTQAALQAARCDGADFRNCRLDEADLRGICLTGAKLDNALMRKVDLRSLQTGQGKRMAADLSDSRLRHADLSGANLDNVRLAGADLSFANLIGANLTNADFTGARLVGCKLSSGQLAVIKSASALIPA